MASATVAPLDFRCTGCGNCCRSLRVAVTALDVARLASAVAEPPQALVAWLPPDAVDMAGEPESFVELDAGRRLMVLAQRDGACQLLGGDNRCSAYAARPSDCRTFPFAFEASASTPRRLTLIPLTDCEYERDGRNDGALLELEDRKRWSELRDYQALVARWNRRAWHCRRLHHAIGSGAAFLAFALETQRARFDDRSESAPSDGKQHQPE